MEREDWETQLPQKPPRKTGRLRKFLNKNKTQVRVVAITLIVLTTIPLSLHRLTAAASEAYHSTQEECAQSTDEAFYTTAFDYAEDHYHVSQNVTINIDSVRESAKLQVYRVNDTVDVIHDKDDNGITLWLEVCGDCVFTTDLQCAEFIVDQNRHYVLVRTPRPQIDGPVNLDYEKTQVLFYNNRKFNESIETGVNLIDQHYKEGADLLETACKSNPAYVREAEKAAKRLIIQNVKKANPDIRDLTVDVEFM